MNSCCVHTSEQRLGMPAQGGAREGRVSTLLVVRGACVALVARGLRWAVVRIRVISVCVVLAAPEFVRWKG